MILKVNPLIARKRTHQWCLTFQQSECCFNRKMTNGRGESEPEPDIPQGEPAPAWDSARQKWGNGWDVHQYGIGVAFGVVAVASTVLLVRTLKRGKSGPALVTVLVLTALFGLTRCLSLCIDAYQAESTLPRLLANFLWGIGNPCLVSSYGLVFIVLRNAFCLKHGFQKWYTARNVVLVAAAYFAFVLATEVTVSLLPSQKLVVAACQALYVFLASFLVVVYSSLLLTLWKSKIQRLHRFRTGPASSVYPARRAWIEIRRKPSTLYEKVVFSSCVTATLGGFLLCALQIYSMTKVYRSASGNTHGPPDAWHWFGLTTAQRLLELSLSCALLLTWSKGTRQRIES